MQKSDILQTDINFIGERSELPFCNNFTLSTKRLDFTLNIIHEKKIRYSNPSF